MATVVSPAAFGAVGDGVTDDTAAFQAALDFAKSGERSLFIPAPSVAYMVSNLTVDYSAETQAAFGAPYGFQAMSIVGEGRRRTFIQQIAGSTGPVLSVTGVQGSGAGAAHNRKLTGLLVEGIEFIGTSGATNHGIQIRNAVDCAFRDLHIRGTGGSGLKLIRDYFVTGTEEFFHSIRFDNIKILEAGRYGMEGSVTAWAGAGTGTGAAGLSFMASNVEAVGCDLGGFYINPSTVSFYECKAFGNGGPGWETFRNPNQDSENFTLNLIGCRAEGNASAGSYEIKIDGPVSGGGLYGCTVLATSGAH